VVSRASKSLRVQASAIPAADIPGYWLPVIVSIDPEIRRSPLGNAVIPELCARMETALSRAEKIVSREYSTWSGGATDGWSRPMATLCCPTTTEPHGGTFGPPRMPQQRSKALLSQTDSDHVASWKIEATCTHKLTHERRSNDNA
jgi:hypothetical protein